MVKHEGRDIASQDQKICEYWVGFNWCLLQKKVINGIFEVTLVSALSGI